MEAYFDCFSGIAGDMIIGAMLDAGLPFKHLNLELSNLKLKGYELKQGIERRGVIGGVNFQVIINPRHCHSRESGNPVKHNLLDSCVRRNDRVNLGHGAHFKEITKLINDSKLNRKIKSQALAIFETLARAEAHVHRTDIDHVHFHEVGGIDSIIDIVGAAIGFDYFGFKKIHCSPLPITRGFVKCAHGKMPVPAPATLEIIKGLPIVACPVLAELVTPTGASVVKTIADSFGACPLGRITKTGYGLGDKDFKEIPNGLRILIGEPEQLIAIEANIDDMNPQLYGHVIEKILQTGAIDAIVVPVIMKKQRPGALLQVLCKDDNRKKITELILKETTTFGVRFFPIERQILEREFRDIKTRYGKVKIKLGFLSGKEIKAVPEYEDCKKIAEQKGVGLLEVYKECQKQLTLR